MTGQPTAIATGSPYRSAGLAAIASGAFGIMTLAFLFVGVSYMLTATHETRGGTAVLLFKAHHVGIILQSLFMLPVAFALQALARERVPGVRPAILTLGVVSLLMTALLALLFLVDVVADDLYTIPQGVLGLWLMFESRRQLCLLSKGFRGFGAVVGLGLLLVGTFPLAYAIFVDPIGLQGPIPPDYPNPDTIANAIIHDVFFVGSLLGVDTYPIWAILLGRRLLSYERLSVSQLALAPQSGV